MRRCSSRLIKREIDPSPTERTLLVSALLMGGNVTVPIGQTVGGDFTHIPACQTNAQTRCVLAYSSFNSPPPANSFFGSDRHEHKCSYRVSGRPRLRGHRSCAPTRPALTGGVGSLDPYFPTTPFPGPRSSLKYGTSSKRAGPHTLGVLPQSLQRGVPEFGRCDLVTGHRYRGAKGHSADGAACARTKVGDSTSMT